MFAFKETVNTRRRQYPAGTKVVLNSMDDPQAPPAGTHGIVQGVDDAGQIMVVWSTGSHLSVIPEAGDSISVIR